MIAQKISDQGVSYPQKEAKTQAIFSNEIWQTFGTRMQERLEHLRSLNLNKSLTTKVSEQNKKK